MRASLIAMTLCAIAGSAAAAGQSHPAANARAHPAASAHANAVAGEGNAARMEACGVASRAFLDAWTKGDDKGATTNFDAAMLQGLGADKLGQLWQSIGTQLGKFQSRGEAQTVMYQDLPVVATSLHFEHGGVVTQLVCNPDGKFGGLHIQPLPATPPVPAASTH